MTTVSRFSSVRRLRNPKSREKRKKNEVVNVALTSADAQKTRCFQNAQIIRKKRKNGGEAKGKRGKKTKGGREETNKKKEEEKRKEEKRKRRRKANYI